MDLAKFKAVDSIRVEIDQAGCEGVAFVLAGPSHPKTKAAERSRTDALANSRRKMKGDALRTMALEFIAARVLAWEGVEWAGEPLELTEANVLMILSNPDLGFIVDQILAAIGDDALLYKSH